MANSGPAISLPIDGKSLELMEQIVAATKDAQKELKTLEQQAKRETMAYGGVKDETAAKLSMANQRVQELKEKQQEQRIKQAVQQDQKRASNRVFSRAGLRSALDIAQMFQGDINTDNIRGAADYLGAVATASGNAKLAATMSKVSHATRAGGPAAIVEEATKRFFEFLQKRADDSWNAAKIDLTTQTQLAELIKNNPINPDTLKEIVREVQDAAKVGDTWSVVNLTQGQQRGARAAKFALEAAEFRRRTGMDANELDVGAMVQRKLSKTELGLKDWLYNETVGRLSGEFDVLQEQVTQDAKRALMRSVEQQRTEEVARANAETRRLNPAITAHQNAVQFELRNQMQFELYRRTDYSEV